MLTSSILWSKQSTVIAEERLHRCLLGDLPLWAPCGSAGEVAPGSDAPWQSRKRWMDGDGMVMGWWWDVMELYNVIHPLFKKMEELKNIQKSIIHKLHKFLIQDGQRNSQIPEKPIENPSYVDVPWLICDSQAIADGKQPQSGQSARQSTGCHSLKFRKAWRGMKFTYPLLNKHSYWTWP